MGAPDGAQAVRNAGDFPVRLLAEGEEPLPVEDEKSVRSRVDRAEGRAAVAADLKPAPDHPCGRGFLPKVTGTAGRREGAPSRGTFLNWREGDILNCFDKLSSQILTNPILSVTE